MTQPMTVRGVLKLLQEQHSARGAAYEGLRERPVAPAAGLLLDRLVDLERESVDVLAKELEQMPERTAFLPSGSPVSEAAARPVGCQHEATPSFSDVLDCALETNAISELLTRLGGIAAPSVQELVDRLKQQEDLRLRQIASFTGS